MQSFLHKVDMLAEWEQDLKGAGEFCMGLLSRFGHDEDGDDGLLVTNRRGNDWKAYGDTHCFDERNTENRDKTIEAGAISLKEVEDASPFTVERSIEEKNFLQTQSSTSQKMKHKLLHKMTGKKALTTAPQEFLALLLVPIPLPPGDNVETSNFAPQFVIDHVRGVTRFRTVPAVNEAGERVPLSEITYVDVTPDCWTTLLRLIASTPRTRAKVLVLVGTLTTMLEKTPVGSAIYWSVDNFEELKTKVTEKVEAVKNRVELAIHSLQMLKDTATVVAKEALVKFEEGVVTFTNSVETTANDLVEAGIEEFELAKKKAAESVIAAQESLGRLGRLIQTTAGKAATAYVEGTNAVVESTPVLKTAVDFWADLLVPIFQ
jgi:hypothetical protein